MDVDDRPYVSRSTLRKVQTHVRKLRADLDELERWDRDHRFALGAESPDISDVDRMVLWCRRARKAKVRAELDVWVDILAWAQATHEG